MLVSWVHVSYIASARDSSSGDGAMAGMALPATASEASPFPWIAFVLQGIVAASTRYETVVPSFAHMLLEAAAPSLGQFVDAF